MTPSPAEGVPRVVEAPSPAAHPAPSASSPASCSIPPWRSPRCPPSLDPSGSPGAVAAPHRGQVTPEGGESQTIDMTPAARQDAQWRAGCSVVAPASIIVGAAPGAAASPLELCSCPASGACPASTDPRVCDCTTASACLTRVASGGGPEARCCSARLRLRASPRAVLWSGCSRLSSAARR